MMIMMMFAFSDLDHKHFLGKLNPKNINCLLKLKFGTSTDANIQNSTAMFTVPVLDQKYPFWQIWSIILKLSDSAEILYLD